MFVIGILLLLILIGIKFPKIFALLVLLIFIFLLLSNSGYASVCGGFEQWVAIWSLFTVWTVFSLVYISVMSKISDDKAKCDLKKSWISILLSSVILFLMYNAYIQKSCSVNIDTNTFTQDEFSNEIALP